MKVLVILSILVAVAMCHEPFQVIFQWNTVDVVWPSEDEHESALKDGEYIPANNVIAGIKFWKDKMYLTLPRWKEGVPVTLAMTSASPVGGVTNPKLEAFPNWDMQKVGDCRAFQLVRRMEIDPAGRMWVLDTGRTGTLTVEVKNACPPRLVILNLENEGAVLRSYEFPPHVARQGTAYLNDIVLDHEDGGMAYITDSDAEDPGIIVYSLRNNTSWKIRHDSMKAKPEAVRFMVSKTPVNRAVHVDGIALSAASTEDRMVYYSPMSSFHLYTLPTSVLKQNMTNVDSYVKELGRKISQTDGMMMSSKGVLYFGLLADDAVAMWDTKQAPSFNKGQRVISRDHERMQWPDTFALKEDGNFYCVTNSYQNFLNNSVNPNVPNLRVIRAKIGAMSYQYYENGSVPEMPDMSMSGATRINVALATGLAVLLAFVAK
ncbi:hypothetical protein KM043_011966 [Ampulex compressa]|nr:hypothetical protein KM043_011966 [Ampulex compressa]